MNATDGPTRIKITHVINPHLFWVKLIDQDADLAEIESKLRDYAVKTRTEMGAARSDVNYENGSIVAVNMVSEKKWVRAQIDDVNDPLLNDEVIVFALDYGAPLRVSLDSVVPLDDDLKQKCASVKTTVFQVGIHGIVPSNIALNVIYFDLIFSQFLNGI